jgi:pyruvate kinase
MLATNSLRPSFPISGSLRSPRKRTVADENGREYKKNNSSTAEVAVWLDINGPKVRTGKLKDGKPIFLKNGNEIVLSNEDVIGDDVKVYFI